ncbi:MAG: group II intron maturase-specific domain-containing protein [Pseudomonadota bacterium]
MKASNKLTLDSYYDTLFKHYRFGLDITTYDVIYKIRGALLKKQKLVLVFDIKGCFDRIDRKSLLPHIKPGFRHLFIDLLKISHTKAGAPRGVPMSPLLVDMILTNMETSLIKHLYRAKGWQIENDLVTAYNIENTGRYYEPKHRVELIRYADNLLLIHENKELIEDSKIFFETWLKSKGFTLSQEQMRVVHSTEGFDFLDFHIRHYKNRIKGTYKLKLLNGTEAERKLANATHVLRVEPTKENLKAHWRTISDIVQRLKAITAGQLIDALQPKITRWANHYKTVNCNEAFNKLDYLLSKRLYQWATRKHPNKGKKWVANKYFCVHNGKSWTFTEKKDGKTLKGYSQHKKRTRQPT